MKSQNKIDFSDFEDLDIEEGEACTEEMIFPIDISCVQPPGYEILSRNVGFHSTNLIKQWLNIYPSLKSVILFLKKFMWIRGFNNSYNGKIIFNPGGLSSYCIILMIFCMMKKNNLLQTAKPSDILLEFFKLYGEDFSYKTTGIALNMNP